MKGAGVGCRDVATVMGGALDRSGGGGQGQIGVGAIGSTPDQGSNDGRGVCGVNGQRRTRWRRHRASRVVRAGIGRSVG
jgi:hypothetical protein